MDKKTLKALKASIVKWDNNAKAETPKQYLTSSDDCPLCKLFNTYGGCTGCPVFEHTRRHYCAKTPYQAARDAAGNWAWDGGDKNKQKALSAAAKEAAFLRSLLPEGETV